MLHENLEYVVIGEVEVFFRVEAEHVDYGRRVEFDFETGVA